MRLATNHVSATLGSSASPTSGSRPALAIPATALLLAVAASGAWNAVPRVDGVALARSARAASSVRLQAVADPTPFLLGTEGCPMAHCDGRMSDGVGLDIPSGPGVAIVWRDTAARGSGPGLGCSSNGDVVACTFRQLFGPRLIVYDFDGVRLWHSGWWLNRFAASSAPIVATDGSVIVADNKRVMRFDGEGRVVWRTATPGGIPISPVLTENGLVVLATAGGPLSAYDVQTGALVAEAWMRKTPSDSGFFDTVNTPAVSGNRIYVSCRFNEADGTNPNYEGRLVALDLDAGGFVEAWHVEFGASSGASPLLIGDTLFFDGDRPSPGANEPKAPTVFAVRDEGDHGEVIWQYSVQGGIGVKASLAHDPRGGVWLFSAVDPNLVRLSEVDGQELERIDVGALIDTQEAALPASAMSVASLDGDPILVFSVAPGLYGKFHVVALNLNRRELEWKVVLAEAGLFPFDSTAGQYPIVSRGGVSRVVFSSHGRGVFAVGVP